MGYPLRYKVEVGQFDPEELKRDGEYGGCDALVLISIMRDHKPPHSGPVSFAAVTVDGVSSADIWKSKEIPVTELFEVWNFLAQAIADNPQAPAWQRKMAKEAFEQVRSKVLQCRQ